MKYKIEIEGGFSGIPKKLTGKMSIDSEKSGQLIRILRKPVPQIQNAGRDMYIYKIALKEGSQKVQAEFTDRSLPTELRSLIDDIKNNTQD